MNARLTKVSEYNSNNPQAQFLTKNGNPRKNGYVVLAANGEYKFFANESQASYEAHKETIKAKAMKNSRTTVEVTFKNYTENFVVSTPQEEALLEELKNTSDFISYRIFNQGEYVPG